MQKILVFLILLISEIAGAQEIVDKNFEQFYKEDILKSNGTLIVNFWATWCKPCIEELPYFEKINSEMKSDEFRVCLVNLDFNSKFRTVTADFVKTKNVQCDVIHLNNSNPNDWINKADSTWSGAIPATMIFKDGRKVFFKEGGITYEELKSKILELENQK